jgi:hypothetical protein
MTCIAEDRLIELLEQGGLEAVRPDEGAHLEACEACRDAWAGVAAAGEVLAEARPRTAGRAARWVPLAAAAATLLTIFGVIASRQTPSPVTTPTKDPITLFIEGSPDEMKAAYETLLKTGRKALPGLVGARPKLKGSPREKLFLDLMWQIKVGAVRQDPQKLAILTKLEATKVDLHFESTALKDIVDFIRDFSGLNIVVDPTLQPGVVETLKIQGQSLRYSLEILCVLKDLDFDVKYGVLFLSTPLRLWSSDPAVGLPGANQIGDGDIATKLRSIRITMDMQNAPLSAIVSYIGEISGLPFSRVGLPDEPVTLKVQDLALSNCLELLTLPQGWNVRIYNGVVTLYDPKSGVNFPSEK